MKLNRCKFNAFLASIALLGACITTEISLAEDQPIGEVTTKTPATPLEDSATVWDKTKEGSAKTWDKTKDVSNDVWGATKDGSAKAWGKTKEVSSNIWDATKEGSAKAWNKTKTTVQGRKETKPESNTDLNQNTSAPSQSP
ncbi:MAG: hypothetical protein HKP57_07600 [Halobacteria archaeon]|nr:hypothetical protein [Halobacteria archaeon]